MRTLRLFVSLGLAASTSAFAVDVGLPLSLPEVTDLNIWGDGALIIKPFPGMAPLPLGGVGAEASLDGGYLLRGVEPTEEEARQCRDLEKAYSRASGNARGRAKNAYEGACARFVGDLRFEVALGYGQYFDLPTVPGVTLRGAVRELPSVSFYVTHHLDGPLGNWGLFGALRTGFLTLADARAYVGGDAVDLAGSTFEAGAGIGLVWSHLFVEVGYRARYFPSLSQSGNNLAEVPRFLRMNGVFVQAGIQVSVGAGATVK